MNKGWECPKCGAVMSPFFPTCWYCSPNITSTDKSSPTAKEKEGS